MAVSYGSAVNTSTNGMRAGLDMWTSSTSTTTTISWELWLWTKRAAFNTAASYEVRSGVDSGSFSFNHTNNSSDWPSSNRTRVASGSLTRTREYGSSQSVNLEGRITGVSAVPGTATVSRSVTVPARGINPPAQQSGAFVYPEQNYTRARLEWTNHSTTAAPYQSIHLERRHILSNGSFSAWTRRANLGRTVTSYTDSVSSNYHFHYRVRANNTAGNGPWLDMGRLNTTPSTPSSVSAQHVGDDIRVSWSHGSRMRSGDVRTVVQHQADGGSWSTVATLGGLPSLWTHAAPSITQTHRYRVRIEVLEWGSAVGSWGYSSTVELAAPPAAPTGLGPSTPWDASEDRVLSWTHVPTDGSDQTRFEVRHRLLGGSWVTPGSVASSASRWTLPGGTYENGDTFEWQVRTWGTHPDPGPYSATNVQRPLGRPTVAINSPVDGETIDTSTVVVSWGFDGAGTQAGWRVRLIGDGTEPRDLSGVDDRSSVTLANLANDTDYTVEVEVRSSHGLWSEVADVATFSTDFLPPPTPEIAGVTWDAGLGGAVVTFEFAPWSEGEAEPVHAQLWRAIGDGPWLLIADGLSLDSAAVDSIPAIGDGTVNYYRVTLVSELPSTADSGVVPLSVPSTGKGGTGGWVYLNAGPGMSQVCRVRANATRSDSEGVAKVLHHFAGRPAPVEYAGTARAREWDVSARIAPDYDGASTREELVELQALPAPVCYRDPLGARWFASMGPVGSSWRGIVGEVSWSMAEVDVTEGLDVQQRDTGQEPAA